jgi:hypothetical protein
VISKVASGRARKGVILRPLGLTRISRQVTLRYDLPERNKILTRTKFVLRAVRNPFLKAMFDKAEGRDSFRR